MRTYCASWVLVGGILAALGLASCSGGEHGNCTETIDGDLYNLRVFNCTSSYLHVQVNNRNVGSVEDMGGDDVCGVTDLGSFAQCSNGKIDVFATDIVATEVAWSEDSLRLNEDDCWVVMTVFSAESVHQDYRLPEVESIDGPECLYLQASTEF